MRAARDFHRVPTALFGGEQDWNPVADVAIVALRKFEDSLCGHCRMSAFHAHDPRNSGEYEVKDDVVCLGCEALEMHGDTKNAPGTLTYIHNSLSDA